MNRIERIVYDDRIEKDVDPTPYEFRLRSEADERKWPEIAPFVTLHFSNKGDAEALALAMLARYGGSVHVSDKHRQITIEYLNGKSAAANKPADREFDPQLTDTGYLTACAACGAGVRVHRHHTVDIEGYTCDCGHASSWSTAAPASAAFAPDWTADLDHTWQKLEEVLTFLQSVPEVAG